MAAAIVYTGIRTARGCRVYVEQGGSVIASLRHRTGARSHSPTGFEWGYAGSGPAELARALVRAVTGHQDPDPRVYQRLKMRIVQNLQGDTWRLTQAKIRDEIAAIELAIKVGEHRSEISGSEPAGIQ